MPNISRKFDSGVGFSNGCALLALKKPPPLVPNCLMISCDATGPCAIVCSRHDRASAACRRRPVVVTVCGSIDRDLVVRPAGSAPRPATRGTARRRSQIGSSTQSERAHQVHPEVAERVLLLLGDAADERDRDRDADRRRHEVVVREPGHLREIAHRRLAAVRLPVRVGRERRGGVEREVRRDRRRIPAGSTAATAAARCISVQHQHRDDAEQQQRDGVLGPAHLARLVDAGQPVDQPLERAAAPGRARCARA